MYFCRKKDFGHNKCMRLITPIMVIRSAREFCIENQACILTLSCTETKTNFDCVVTAVFEQLFGLQTSSYASSTLSLKLAERTLL